MVDGFQGSQALVGRPALPELSEVPLPDVLAPRPLCCLSSSPPAAWPTYLSQHQASDNPLQTALSNALIRMLQQGLDELASTEIAPDVGARKKMVAELRRGAAKGRREGAKAGRTRVEEGVAWEGCKGNYSV